jgi:tetratricopeptide (TPR) repeat protein
MRIGTDHGFSFLIGAFAAVLALLCYGIYLQVYPMQLGRLFREDRLYPASMFFMRGNYYFGDGAYDLAQAEANFYRALGYENHANEPILYQLGRVYFIKGELAEAVSYFDQQLAADPAFVKSYYMRGLTYGYLNDFVRAEQDFKKFIETKPHSWAAHNDLAWVYFRAGRYKEAEEQARQGLEYAAGNPWLQNALGAALINQGRYEEAREPLLNARDGFALIGPEGWGMAYPGNDPRIYAEGHAASLASVDKNLELIEQRLRGG